MFLQDQYKIVAANKGDAHFCFECLRVNVELNVKNKMSWREGEKYSEEREKLKRALWTEYSLIFKQEVYRRYRAEMGLKKKSK